MKLEWPRIRAAIAKVCGWQTKLVSVSGLANKVELWFGPNGEVNRLAPTDYPGDLNAMREAEATLTSEQCGRYEEILRLVRHPATSTHSADGYIWHATASERAEAFLRALNLWTED